MKDMQNLMQRAIASAMEEKILEEAFTIMVKRYFEEYSDATEVDHKYRSAMEFVFNLCLDGLLDDDFDTFLEKLEKEFKNG